MRITNTQKSELSEIFKRVELNKLDFIVSGEYKEFHVKFKHEYYSFTIEKGGEDSYGLTIYAVNNTQGYRVDKVTWQNTKAYFVNWTKQIAIELATPTGWETFQSENYLNAEFEELNQEFSKEEKSQARINILELKEKIKSLDLPEESLKIIDKKLDDLSKKVDELNKFDWKSLFLGTFASLIMTLAIPAEVNGIIWEYIKSAFGGLKIKG